MTKTAINGCGRIGRLALRLAWNEAEFSIVHLNDVAAIESVAYLIQYDSVHGTWGVKVKADSATGMITFTEGNRTPVSIKYERDISSIEILHMRITSMSEVIYMSLPDWAKLISACSTEWKCCTDGMGI